jgi:hypothetical protein
VLAAYRAAEDAAEKFTNLAVISGLLFHEYRAEILPQTREASGRFNPKESDSSWLAWLDRNNIPVRKAQRYMNAAERIARHQLRIPMNREFASMINVNGVEIPLSQALTAPTSKLPEQALEFRHGLLDFIKEKSLSEAVLAAIDGESPEHHITRAANGKDKGGSLGEDRKDFPLFAGRALADCLHHIGAKVDRKGGHWGTLTAVGKEKAFRFLDLFIQGLPTELVEFLDEASHAERKSRQKGNQPQPLALKALVNKMMAETKSAVRAKP